ncbi:CPBP family intramembrane glutamic endopeptidase [Salinispora oceanensis]|uniref:CPBP family intramembrane glutamic endopeptidase n=1 Tax=Salinispora oceanensis TaxID=1050199 RepID=UPI00035F2577|nr:CPBP family intramembrane glutamic endopeptidase [Salinispora oceanensis]
MRLLKQLGAVVPVALVGGLGVTAATGNPLLTLALGAATAVLAVLAYRWAVRRTERRAPVEVSRAGAGAAVGRGVLIGVGMFAVVVGSIALFGGYRVVGWGSPTGMVTLFGVMAAAAVTEELIFRGILFRIVEQRIGTWAALILTGLLFGILHLFNPNASLWSSVAIAIEAGGMLAAAYAATRTLWLPIGLHFGWNFTQAGIFGTAVSGNSETVGLLESVLMGPAAISGGEFGPEASLFAVLAGAGLTVVFMSLARRRGEVVPAARRGSLASTGAKLPR